MCKVGGGGGEIGVFCKVFKWHIYRFIPENENHETLQVCITDSTNLKCLIFRDFMWWTNTKQWNFLEWKMKES